MIENKINTSCPISRDEFNDNDDVIQIKHCNHIISEEELIKWFKISKSCPLCTYNIESNAYNTSIQELRDNNIMDNSSNDISTLLETSIQHLLNNSQSFSIEYSLLNPRLNPTLNSRIQTPIPIRRVRYPLGVRRTTYDNSSSS